MPFATSARPAPGADPNYEAALARLTDPDTAITIGHVDTGITAHPALGFQGTTPPANLLLRPEANLLEPGTQPFSGPTRPEPLAACLSRADSPTGIGNCLNAYPDHGTKTLSMLLGATDRMQGIAPGARVMPVRIAEGPVLFEAAAQQRLGEAIRLLLRAEPRPRVISISMGNPRSMGLWDLLTAIATGRSPGLPGSVLSEIEDAARKGVIIVCAAGQLLDRVVQPAAHRDTISVGGVRSERDARGRLRHYPGAGYGDEEVDVVATADGWNRATTLQRAGAAAPEYLHAEDLGGDLEDVSGTSYAAPLVAGAAALWLALYAQHLQPRSGDNRWITAAFRRALAASSDRRPLYLDGPQDRIRMRPVLNLGRLLAMAPEV